MPAHRGASALLFLAAAAALARAAPTSESIEAEVEAELRGVGGHDYGGTFTNVAISDTRLQALSEVQILDLQLDGELVGCWAAHKPQLGRATPPPSRLHHHRPSFPLAPPPAAPPPSPQPTTLTTLPLARHADRPHRIFLFPWHDHADTAHIFVQSSGMALGSGASSPEDVERIMHR